MLTLAAIWKSALKSVRIVLHKRTSLEIAMHSDCRARGCIECSRRALPFSKLSLQIYRGAMLSGVAVAVYLFGFGVSLHYYSSASRESQAVIHTVYFPILEGSYQSKGISSFFRVFSFAVGKQNEWFLMFSDYLLDTHVL